MKEKAFVIEKTYNASVARVWKAITNKEEMKHWYFDLEEFKAEKGFKFQFEGGPDDGIKYVHLCEVTDVINEKKISYTWKYEGYEGCSEVTFELFPEGGKTRLVLTHAGLETFPANNPDFAKKNFEAGWNDIIGNSLTKYLEEKVSA
jgi:uncharacterized protein YndB with AHSA1/START domain